MMPRFSQDVRTNVVEPLGVTLAGFEVYPQGAVVLVTWETVSEINNAGFNLYRTETAGSQPGANDLLAFVPSAAPGSSQGATYEWMDDAIEPGATAYYWLETVDFGGNTVLYGPVTVVMQVPTSVRLIQLDAASRRSPVGMPAGVMIVVAVASAWLIRRRVARIVR